MAREADFMMDCSSYSNSIAQIIAAFNQIGWSYSGEQIEYLPLHDHDSFDWQKKTISVEELFSMLSIKQELGELCGVVLYHQYSDRGITILARSTKEFVVNININRKTICGDFTDISWYMEHIAAKLEEIGCIVTSVDYREVIG